MRYVKGQSGNPAGKPKGARDRRTELRALLQPHAEALINKAVSMALEGDPTALRLCLDRVVSPVKARDEVVEVDGLEGSLAEQGRKVIESLSSGAITPDQANALMQVLQTQARIVEVDELEKRVQVLEGQSATS